MKERNLPGITGVEYCQSSELYPDYQELITEGSVISVNGDFISIPIVGIGGCVVTSEMVSGQPVYTTVLKFRIKDQKEDSRKLTDYLKKGRISFRVTDVYQEKYLIGLDSKPHPVVKTSYNMGTLPTGERCYDIEVTYVNIHSTIQLKD